MTLEVRQQFAIFQQVWIVPLVVEGRVMAIYEDSKSVQFYVRYFYNGDAKYVYFLADELSTSKP
ncbi:hypothetical protein [Nevskia sp.]|uniref:hypothetical protein n=1 Tax=Nevskia sp. TaxID=1929292 RepID=UPI0025F2407E|nr:hypothetical protein [Nevskia sp.]